MKLWQHLLAVHIQDRENLKSKKKYYFQRDTGLITNLVILLHEFRFLFNAFLSRLVKILLSIFCYSLTYILL
jgi:hypothetical protein